VWLGRLRYRQGRFEEAAALHAQAAEGQAWITERTAARLDGASALMEAFQHEEALAQAREALVLARGCRHAFYEGRAEWLLRSIAYRTGVTDGAGPDGELVEAVARLGVAELLALVALNEAAVAFRAGDLGAARDLAGRARRLWIENGQPLGPLLAGGLLLASGEPVSGGEAAALVDRALGCSTPGVGLQALGLLASCGAARGVDRGRAEALAALVPRRFWHLRMEILSIDESLERLGMRA
jgi:tetratricopeptide (TPR) repeat protein